MPAQRTPLAVSTNAPKFYRRKSHTVSITSSFAVSSKRPISARPSKSYTSTAFSDNFKTGPRTRVCRPPLYRSTLPIQFIHNVDSAYHGYRRDATPPTTSTARTSSPPPSRSNAEKVPNGLLTPLLTQGAFDADIFDLQIRDGESESTAVSPSTEGYLGSTSTSGEDALDIGGAFTRFQDMAFARSMIDAIPRTPAFPPSSSSRRPHTLAPTNHQFPFPLLPLPTASLFDSIKRHKEDYELAEDPFYRLLPGSFTVDDAVRNTIRRSKSAKNVSFGGVRYGYGLGLMNLPPSVNGEIVFVDGQGEEENGVSPAKRATLQLEELIEELSRSVDQHLSDHLSQSSPCPYAYHRLRQPERPLANAQNTRPLTIHPKQPQQRKTVEEVELERARWRTSASLRFEDPEMAALLAALDESLLARPFDKPPKRRARVQKKTMKKENLV